MITAMMVWCLSKGLLNGDYITGGIIADIIIIGMFFSFLSNLIEKIDNENIHEIVPFKEPVGLKFFDKMIEEQDIGGEYE
jgi:hypothetical protein